VLNTYDFIFIEGSYMGLYVDFIKKHTPAKVVLRSHNVEYTIWERLAASLTNPFKKWYIQTLIQKIKKFEIQTLPKYDIVVPITDVDAAFYKSNGANNCITICAGVDIDSSEIPYEDTNQNICFIGSMEWMPNVQGVDWFLNHVWPLIQKQNPNCTFHIAGKGMDQRFNRWKQNGIVLHGQVADAKEFILKNGIFIVPLLSGGGMRLKVVEAMGFRKPIVTTSIGAEGIQVVHKQNCMLSDTAEDFAASILHLIANKEFAKDIADSAYNTVKDNYNWSALANKLYKHLQSIQ
jgi:glycosyltransferase involved in cell wall biosynthesis